MKRLEMNIERCLNCPYNDDEIGWCKLNEPPKMIEDYNNIPSWCPLPDIKDDAAGVMSK